MFSPADRESNSAELWKTIPIFFRTRMSWSSVSGTMSSPSISTWPASGFIRPTISLSVTLLPIPLPPMMVTVSAGRIIRSMPLKTGVLLNDLKIWRNSMIASLTSPALQPPEELREEEIRDDDDDGRGGGGGGGGFA